MIYSYSSRNRLVEPHHYMYTPFEGATLLEAFLASRLGVLRQLPVSPPADTRDAALVDAVLAFIDHRLEPLSPDTLDQWRLLVAIGPTQQTAVKVPRAPIEASNLAGFSPHGDVSTSALLTAMMCALLEDAMQDQTRLWLDRVMQRFEVTKRLYETYPAGFRKGVGDFGCLRRYWMLALVLCLSLANASSLRLLNTLLKVCDLLCSVDIDDLRKAVPGKGMRIVLAMEAVSVRALMTDKGLPCVAV